MLRPLILALIVLICVDSSRNHRRHKKGRRHREEETEELSSQFLANSDDESITETSHSSSSSSSYSPSSSSEERSRRKRPRKTRRRRKECSVEEGSMCEEECSPPRYNRTPFDPFTAPTHDVADEHESRPEEDDDPVPTVSISGGPVTISNRPRPHRPRPPVADVAPMNAESCPSRSRCTPYPADPQVFDSPDAVLDAQNSIPEDEDEDESVPPQSIANPFLTSQYSSSAARKPTHQTSTNSSSHFQSPFSVTGTATNRPVNQPAVSMQQAFPGMRPGRPATKSASYKQTPVGKPAGGTQIILEGGYDININSSKGEREPRSRRGPRRQTARSQDDDGDFERDYLDASHMCACTNGFFIANKFVDIDDIDQVCGSARSGRQRGVPAKVNANNAVSAFECVRKCLGTNETVRVGSHHKHRKIEAPALRVQYARGKFLFRVYPHVLERLPVLCRLE